VIVTGGASKTVPGGMINGNGVGGTSGVIVTGGAANNRVVVASPGGVIVSGGALTSGGVGGTNAPARIQ
jgi:hypothetical protein